jgi:GAF domain-containing protein
VDNRETWLAETLVELADTSAAGFDDEAYLATLATRLAELLGRAEIGLIIAAPTGEPLVAAATSDRIRDLLAFELTAGDGPCITCYRSGQRIVHAAIGDGRWPLFATRARSAGFRSANALPMRRHHDTIGAVAILDVRGGRFSATDIGLAQNLAEAATISLRQQRALQQSARTARQLQQALDSRVLIEQAKGMTAARLGVSLDEAFDLLRGHARRHNRKLADVAADAIHQRLSTLGGWTAARRRTAE